MRRTRRAVLRAGAALSSLGLAGCSRFTGGSVSYPGGGSDGDGGSDGGSGGTQATQSPETTQPPATTRSPTTTQPTTVSLGEGPNQSLASSTDQVFRELRWFAASYVPARHQYRSLNGQVQRTIRQLVQSSDITDYDVQRLLSVAERFRSFALANVVPHFYVEPETVEKYSSHVNTVAKFARRGDLDRTNVELRRALSFYESINNESYLTHRLSDDPIADYLDKNPAQPTLLDYLRGGADAPLLYVVDDPVYQYTAFVYPKEGPRLVGAPEDAPVSDPMTTYRASFDPLLVPQGRRNYQFVTPVWIPERPGTVVPTELPYQPILIQQYADATAARNATTLMLDDGPVTQDGTQNLGSTEWRRVYYFDDGDITYAYLVQAGPYLLATAPATTPWEERGVWIGPPWDEHPRYANPLYDNDNGPMLAWAERPDWTGPLERSWVW